VVEVMEGEVDLGDLYGTEAAWVGHGPAALTSHPCRPMT
jgi:hypothetical protein